MGPVRLAVGGAQRAGIGPVAADHQPIHQAASAEASFSSTIMPAPVIEAGTK